MKKCWVCKETLPLTSFGNNKSKSDKLSTECRKCKAIKDREYRDKNEEKLKLKSQDYYVKNREKIIAKSCLQAKLDPIEHNKRGHKAKTKLKFETFSKYSQGTPICKWCGEMDIGILTIDHIDGNGGNHRREIFNNKRKAGSTMYRWLKKNNYPDGFQVLCCNCQFRKRAVEMRPVNPTHRQLMRAKCRRLLKIQCLKNYGGCQCSCGEKDLDVLTLGHVNDDGAKHRRETGTFGCNFYYLLRNNNFPNDPPLNVECMNCQFKKRNAKYDRERKDRSSTSLHG